MSNQVGRRHLEPWSLLWCLLSTTLHQLSLFCSAVIVGSNSCPAALPLSLPLVFLSQSFTCLLLRLPWNSLQSTSWTCTSGNSPVSASRGAHYHIQLCVPWNTAIKSITLKDKKTTKCNQKWIREMAQQDKVPVTNPEDQSSTPGPTWKEEKNDSPQVALDLHTCTHAHTDTHTHIKSK